MKKALARASPATRAVRSAWFLSTSSSRPPWRLGGVEATQIQGGHRTKFPVTYRLTRKGALKARNGIS